ncbi:MAG: hypothetical protein WCD81_02845 [Candidatus Bathyarchaeia archaeon]
MEEISNVGASGKRNFMASSNNANITIDITQERQGKGKESGFLARVALIL